MVLLHVRSVDLSDVEAGNRKIRNAEVIPRFNCDYKCVSDPFRCSIYFGANWRIEFVKIISCLSEPRILMMVGPPGFEPR